MRGGLSHTFSILSLAVFCNHNHLLEAAANNAKLDVFSQYLLEAATWNAHAQFKTVTLRTKSVPALHGKTMIAVLKQNLRQI